MKKIILFLSILVVVSSCKTNQLFINVHVPAPVTMSNSVKKIGIMNRSIPNEQEKVQNAAHQVLSAQSFAMLKEGGSEGIRGLKDALLENKRFEQIAVLDSVGMKSAAIGLFPSPLSWDKVESICAANKIDALFVLELFDTELKVSPNSVPVNITNPMQVVNAVQNVSMTTIVKTGWRIYVPANHRIIDEYTVDRNTSFSGTANPLGAVDALLQRKEAIKQVANECGHAYAERILPDIIRVDREYFVKGSPAFKIAMRRARTGNWDGAAEIWLKEVNSHNSKAAGRACYNMGIINEINGNLDEAIKWTQKAYEDYGVRLSLNYIRILKARKAEENLLEKQATQ
jgi:tetratricopeptide (TPR) repeat protein